MAQQPMYPTHQQQPQYAYPVQPGYGGGAGGRHDLAWATNRRNMVLVQTPDCCARQKFRIYDGDSDKRQVMRTDTDCDCCGEYCPTDSRVFVTQGDGSEQQTHAIISSDTGCCQPKWKLTSLADRRQLGYASLLNGPCDICGCPPTLKMKAVMPQGNTFTTQAVNPPSCCDGMVCPGERYDFRILNSHGKVVANAAKLPLQTFASYFMGVNNYSIAFDDPSLSPDDRATLLTLIIAADFHFWKPKNNN